MMAILELLLPSLNDGVVSSLSLSSLFQFLFFALSVYGIYQAYFHPLSKYPGPFLAKLTNIYQVYRAVQGNQHWDLYQLHNRHGRYVRYGPNHVSVLSTSALEEIYGYKVNVQKSEWYSGFYSISIFNCIDRDVHATKKRVMSQAFSNQAVRGMEPHILSAIQKWVMALGETPDDTTEPVAVSGSGWTSPRDMAKWSAYVIFDALGEICFGKSFDTATKTDNHFFFSMMILNVWILNVTGQIPYSRKLGLSSILRYGTEADREKQVDFSRKTLGERLASNPDTTKRRDIIYYLQQARDPETGEGYSQQELVNEVTLLLGAGSDTANTAVAATFYFLAYHPEVLERLTMDVRRTFDSVQSITTGTQMQSLTYLRACIDESLRLCPPVPMLLPRKVLPGGARVGEEFFPEGTIIGVPTYALHHSVEHFDEPFKYRPSRWLKHGDGKSLEEEGVSEHVYARQRKAFAPFSVGPRSCIGRGVAMVELEVSLARVLYLYDIRIAPGTESLGVGPEREYKIRDHFIVGKEGPVLQFKQRS